MSTGVERTSWSDYVPYRYASAYKFRTVVDEPIGSLCDPVFSLREHVSWQIVDPSGSNEPVRNAILFKLHPNEHEVSDVWLESVGAEAEFSRLEVHEAHELARRLDRRDYVRPLTDSEILSLQPSMAYDLVIMSNTIGLDELTSVHASRGGVHIRQKLDRSQASFLRAHTVQSHLLNVSTLYNAKRFDEAEIMFKTILPDLTRMATGNFSEGQNGKTFFWHLGKRIDLNRQFNLDDTTTTWESVFHRIRNIDARLLLSVIRKNPDLTTVVSVHEDHEAGKIDNVFETHFNGDRQIRDGMYIYYSPQDARSDRHFDLVSALMERTRHVLRRYGFSRMNGIDNQNDPALGYTAVDGFIYQPLMNDRGERAWDTTFENAVVLLGRIGLTKVRESFTIEVPGGLSKKRKGELLSIIFREFINPFVKETHA